MSRILIIEPDGMLAQTYLKGLSAAGYDVDICSTAQSAILSADQNRPDLVVLELQLVGHGGIEFLYEFRSYADWRHVPVVLLTYVPAGEFSDCRQLLRDELEVRTYLYKPRTNLRQLLRCINELLTASTAVS